MIGIIPCAGKSTRFGGLPKFLLPTPEGSLIDVLRVRMWTLERLLIATNTANHGLLLPYAPFDVNTQTMSETVLSFLPYIPQSESVGFGMPDTYFEDRRAFPKLVGALENGIDVAVGVFVVRPGQHSEGGMCQIENDTIIEIVDKPESSDLNWIWGVMAWTPSFWHYIHASDPHIGYSAQRAIEAGLNVAAVRMDGGLWDCGTPERYFALMRHLLRGFPK